MGHGFRVGPNAYVVPMPQSAMDYTRGNGRLHKTGAKGQRMAFDDVYVISDKLDPAIEDQIRTPQASLHTRFPLDYWTYVTLLGAGSLNENVRVLPPTEIAPRRLL